MDKQRSKRISLAALATLSVLASMSPARISFAHDRSENPSNRAHHQKLEKAFVLGVCVGEGLAQKGIRISPHEIMRGSSLDPHTRRALQKEVRVCREELRRAGGHTSSSSSEGEEEIEM